MVHINDNIARFEKEVLAELKKIVQSEIVVEPVDEQLLLTLVFYQKRRLLPNKTLITVSVRYAIEIIGGKEKLYKVAFKVNRDLADNEKRIGLIISQFFPSDNIVPYSKIIE